MRESPLRRRGRSSCEAILGTGRTWQPYWHRKAPGSGSGSYAYLRLIRRQASCRMAVAVQSSLKRKVTWGA